MLNSKNYSPVILLKLNDEGDFVFKFLKGITMYSYDILIKEKINMIFINKSNFILFKIILIIKLYLKYNKY